MVAIRISYFIVNVFKKNSSYITLNTSSNARRCAGEMGEKVTQKMAINR